MTAQTEGTAATQALTDMGEGGSLWSQLVQMSRAFFSSPLRNLIVWLAAASFVVIVATAIGQILLNRWNRPFYDAIERRDLTAFLDQLLVFAAIATGLLTFNIMQQWLNQMVRLKLREGLTLDLIGEWMQPRRAFRLAKAGAIGVNPDQRMQQDAGHLADLSTDLGFGLLQASILLASFVGVLWSLSSGFVFHVGGRSFEIPGYMVWAAILYAGSASWLSWLVGRPLIGLNSERYSREADLRFSLMHVNEHIDAVSLAGGEAGEKRRLELDLASVLAAMRGIFRAQIKLAWVTDGYGWFTTVAPILIAAPVYFAGDLTFGGLMMAVGAFNQVNTSLRWFITNIGAIADWRATLLRVAVFRFALVEADALHGTEKRIEFVENKDDLMTFDEVEIAAPGGCTKLAEPHVEIAAGERVVIGGDPRAGKTLFFRAVAGLWPWGSGRIGLPAGTAVAFIPRTPYFPPGTLRDVLSYPDAGGTYPDAELKAALSRAGLPQLAGSLDRQARWERELGEDEQRLLALARIRVQRPRWVVVDEVFDAMGGDALKRALSIFEDELAATTIIRIGDTQHNRDFFPRVIQLVRDAEGRALKTVSFEPRERRVPAAKKEARTGT